MKIGTVTMTWTVREVMLGRRLLHRTVNDREFLSGHANVCYVGYHQRKQQRDGRYDY